MSGVVADGLTSQEVLVVSVEKGDANETLHRFVRHDGTRAGAGVAALGVGRMASATSGDLIPVAVLGIVPVEAGAAIAVANGMKQVMSDASGRAIAYTAGNTVTGVVLGAASAAGDIVPVLLTG